MKFKDKLLKKTEGFSLMEAMVAIFVVLVGLIGTMSLITQSISSGQRSINRLIAANLAQEGIEVVKNMRDESYYGGGESTWDGWYGFFSTGVTYEYSVQYDSIYNGAAPYGFGNSSAAFLKINGSGLYSYDGEIETPFKRKIVLEKKSDDEIDITCVVTWNDHGTEQTVTVMDQLWNWR